MAPNEVAAWVQALAALATLVTAIVAVRIAAHGPERSAKFAETYRAQSRDEENREQLRRLVLMSLMKCRRQMLHADAIAAINLVDVAFMNDKAVRGALTEFNAATFAEPHDPTRVVERYLSLIYEIARAMGMATDLTMADIRAGYYPTALSRLDEAALAEAEEKIARRASGTAP